MALTLEKLVLKFVADTKDIRKSTAQVKSSLTSVEAKAGRLQRRFRAMGTSIKSSFRGVANAIRSHSVAIIGALTGIATAMVATVKKAVDYGNQIDRMVKKTGMSAMSLSKLAYAAEQEHASIDALEKALTKLSRTMEYYIIQPSSEYAKAFQMMGIDPIDRMTGRLRNAADVFKEISEWMATTKDDTMRAATALTLFGRAGGELIPFLRLGKAELERLGDEAVRLGVAVGDDFPKQAKRFSDNMTVLETRVKGISIELTTGLLPALEAVTYQMGQGAGGAGTSMWTAIGKWAAGVIYTVNWIVTVSKKGWAEILGMSKVGFGEIVTTIKTVATVISNIFRWLRGEVIDLYRLVEVKISNLLDKLRPAYARKYMTYQPLVRETFGAMMDTQNDIIKVSQIKMAAAREKFFAETEAQASAMFDKLNKMGFALFGVLPRGRWKAPSGAGAGGQAAAGATPSGAPELPPAATPSPKAQEEGSLFDQWISWGATIPEAWRLALSGAQPPGMKGITPAGPIGGEPTVSPETGEAKLGFGDLFGSIQDGIKSVSTQFAGFVSQLVTGAARGRKAWGDFFKSLLGWLVQAIVKVMVLRTVLRIFRFITGGGGGGLGAGVGAGVGAQRGAYTGESEGLVFVHRHEVITPLDTLSKLVSVIASKGGGGAIGGGGTYVNQLIVQPALASGYDAREFLRNLSDYVDVEMRRGL